MATHPGMLIAYDAAGNVVGTLDFMVQYDNDELRTPLGVVDFASFEEQNGENTDIWVVGGAVGSKVWPEWIGQKAYDFKVELAGPAGAKHIEALVHKTSGLRRERTAIEAEIRARLDARTDVSEAVDIRDVVGGPDRPLLLDDDGNVRARVELTRPTLPLTTIDKK